MRTAILGGHVIDPANRVDGKLNLVMENGKIVWAGREKPDADRSIDASGLVEMSFRTLMERQDFNPYFREAGLQEL